MGRMKTVNDIATRLDGDNVYILLGKDVSLGCVVNKSVMLVTHDFSKTGAPVVLLEMAKIIREMGISVWVLCNYKGELVDSFGDAGVNVVMYPAYKLDDKWFEKTKNTFDFWCVNTITLDDVFKKLNNTLENVIWWLHERQHWFEVYEKSVRQIGLGKRSKILAAGPYVKDMAKTYMDMDIDILNFPIEDIGVFKGERKSGGKVRFLQVGTIDGNKGQGLLADAVKLLDDSVRDKAEFVFCGSRDGADESEIEKIDSVVGMYSNVTFIPPVQREQLLKMYEDFDSVIVASRQEPTSAIAVEMMMKGKFGICSDGCGVAKYLEDGVSGFVFENDNVTDLVSKITYVVNNIESLKSVNEEARKVYENIYSKEVFVKHINDIFDWCSANENPMLKEPLVSVVAFTHNNARGLLNSLKSIYNQTYKNIEVVVIDDASDDSTVELVDEHFGEKENLKYFINDVQMGEGASYDFALENCEGQYIAFIKAGDEWISDKIERQLEVLVDNKEYDGAYSYAQVFSSDGTNVIYPAMRLDEKDRLKSNIRLLMMENNNKIHLGTVLVKAETLRNMQGFNCDLDANASYEFAFRELGVLNMYRVPDVKTVTMNKPVAVNDIEDYIKANYYLVVNSEKYINESYLKENFFETILMQMDECDAKDIFLELLSDNNVYEDIVAKNSKKCSEKQCVDNNIAAVQECIGCQNCCNACEFGAISMARDDKGFSCPVIDEEKCILCGRCMDVCPLCNEVQGAQVPKNCLAMQMDDLNRMKASSGGVFPAIAKEFVKGQEAYICGAIFDSDFKVKHIVSNNIADIEKMFESKYVQSDLGDCFVKIRELLENGNKVMFAGTPCQNAALDSFLCKEYEGLYKISIVCHGVPSPEIYDKYIQELRNDNGEIKELSFRKKEKLGWNSGVYARFESGREVVETSETSWYMKLFLDDIILRDSCYNCRYKDIAYGDLLLGDFWGITLLCNMEDGKGTSYVASTSKKGDELLESIDKQIKAKRIVQYKWAVEFNKCINDSVEKKKIVDGFWKEYIIEKNISGLQKALSHREHFDIALVLMWSRNYGNALTNYGLYKALEKMGQKVVVLDNTGTLYPDGAFEVFARNNYNCSSDYIFSRDYENVVNLADAYVVGSDQTWNYKCEINHGFGSYYQLSFVPDNKKKFAYGSSFGSSEDFKDAIYVKHLYQRFDAIGVREYYGVDICKKEYGVDASLVLDPVFLLDKNDYDGLARKSKINISEPFVVSYLLNPNAEKIEAVKKIGDSLGAKVVSIIDADKYHKDKNMLEYDYKDCLYGIDIEDFVYYFANSEFIVTDSFHGTCFALIFNKRFMTIRNRQSERFNIFEKFGDFSKRIYCDLSSYDIDELLQQEDYDSVNERLIGLKEESLEWIRKNIVAK